MSDNLEKPLGEVNFDNFPKGFVGWIKYVWNFDVFWKKVPIFKSLITLVILGKIIF